MAKFIVKPGRSFGAFSQYQAGDIVEIDPELAEPFADKLTAYDVDGAEEEAEEEVNFGSLPDRIVLALVAEGVTPDVLTLMSDDDLLAIDGIGEGSVADIRKQYPEAK